MPIIPLADPASGLSEQDCSTVFAIMCRPSDPGLHRTLELLTVAEGLALTCQEEGPPPDGLRVALPVQDVIALARAEPLERLRQSLPESGFGGAVAGDLLLFVLNCAERAPEHVGIEKAIFVEMADLVGTRLHSGGKPPAGRSEVYNAWIAFKPAAHLWAAFRLWQNDFQQPPACDYRTPAGLLGFLALAEELRARAATIKARGQKRPVLSPSETWRVPESLALPPTTLQIPPLTDWARARLQEYEDARRAPKKPVK